MNKLVKIANNKLDNHWVEENKLVAIALSQLILESNLGTKTIGIEISENGFSVDFETSKNISSNQLEIITGKLNKLLSNFKSEHSTILGKDIKKIALLNVSGLTLEGHNANRISGFGTTNKDTFEAKLAEIKDREERDHRKIAKDLELFFIDDLVGKGLPIWLPNGVHLKSKIRDYVFKLEEKYGYQHVETPVLGMAELYKTSGHYYHYKANMYPDMINQEKEEIILRPMACPHHIIVYKHKPRSYRELPFRIAEQVKQYRYEASGALIGLERVRSMELTDGHIFLMQSQLENELEQMYEMIVTAINKFGINVEYVELALHDPNDKEKYHGNSHMWQESEKILKAFLDKNNIKYKALTGEAAFYGPKIDFQIKTALGHLITMSTIQLDFLLPDKFKLEYIDSNNQRQVPIMIHRGVIGTFERFISVLLEQTKGNLPFWLSPKQAVVIPVNEVHNEYAKKIHFALLHNNIKATLDNREERLSYKIREAQTSKVKIQVILGDEEVKNNTVSYRLYGSEQTQTLSIDDFISFILKQH